MPTSLLNILSQRLNAPPEVVERALYLLVNKIRLQVASEGSANVPDLGTFRFFNGDLVFEPTEALSVAVNYRFSGLEPVTISPSQHPRRKQEVPALAAEDEAVEEISAGTLSTPAFRSTSADRTWTETEPEPHPPGRADEFIQSPEQETGRKELSDAGTPLASTPPHVPVEEAQPETEEPPVVAPPVPGTSEEILESQAVVDCSPQDAEDEIGQIQEDSEEVVPTLPEEGGVEVPPLVSDEAVEPGDRTESPDLLAETWTDEDVTPAESSVEEPVSSADFAPVESSVEEPVSSVEEEAEPVAILSSDVPKGHPTPPPPGRISTPETRREKQRNPLVLVGGLSLVALLIAALVFFLVRDREPAVLTPVEQQPPALTSDTAATVTRDTTNLAAIPQGQSQVPIQPSPQEPALESTEDIFASPLKSENGVDIDAGGFSLVVASRAGSDAAESVAETYRNLGFRSSVLHGPYQGVTRYRVVVGQFRDGAEAFAALRDPANELPEDAWVLPLSKSLEVQDQ